MSFHYEDADPRSMRTSIISVDIDGQCWSFEQGGEVADSPQFPLRCYGVAVNNSYPEPRLRYAVDSAGHIWAGSESDGILLCEDDAYLLGLLFTYNPLSWATVCVALGGEAVQTIIDSCDWSLHDGDPPILS
jgi:hypothetical protein